MRILKDEIFYKAGENGYVRNRIPGIVCDDNGNMIIYYECRNGGDWSVSEIGCRISCDNGKTWTKEEYIASGKGKYTVNNPVMIENNGVLHFLWLEDYKRGFYRTSNDFGKTWSEITDITYVVEEFREEYPWTVAAFGPGHGVITVAGRIVVPIWLTSNLESIHAHFPNKIATIYSDDFGKTWKRGEIITTDVVNPNETAICNINNGEVLINIRHVSETRRRYFAKSKTGIDGWYDKKFADDLKDPICQGSMCSSGDLILCGHCDHEEIREDFSISKITPDGELIEKLYIEKLGGYSDICINPVTKTAFVIYEHDSCEFMKLAEIEI